MRRATKVLIIEVTGFAVAVGLLATGLVLTVRQLDSVATRQMNEIRGKEYQITLAERLRWTGTILADNERAYTQLADPQLLVQAQRAQDELDRIVNELEARSLEPNEARLVDEIERAAAEYMRSQPDRARELALEHSLDTFVDAIESHIQGVYANAARERLMLKGRIYYMLAAAIGASLLVALYFARLVGRTYRATERELERGRKEAIRTRDELMGIVAHDLRNPLSAIALRAATMQNEQSVPVLHRQARAVGDVARRMERLIRSMLDVAALEAGAFSVTRARADVDELVRSTVETLGEVAAAKGIALESRIEQRGLGVRIDEERIEQVLGNLVGNALEFTPRGGRIEISAGPHGGDVVFRVRDTGPGIAPEHLPRIFDRFWGSGSRPRAGGRGLGLFIAKGIVEAHGGRIWVDSQPGHGATFQFTIPIDGAPTAPVATGVAGTPVPA